MGEQITHTELVALVEECLDLIEVDSRRGPKTAKLEALSQRLRQLRDSLATRDEASGQSIDWIKASEVVLLIAEKIASLIEGG